MRYALLILVWFAIAAQAQDWRELFNRYPLPPLNLMPKVTVVAKNTGSIKVRVENATKTDLSYQQYTGSTSPSLYWEEKISGKWEGTDWPWCGTGRDEKELLPGNSLDLDIPIEGRKHPFKIFMLLSEQRTEKCSFVLLYESE